MVLPGGFSNGDYLRTGAIARFSPVMEEVAAFAREGYRFGRIRPDELLGTLTYRGFWVMAAKYWRISGVCSADLLG